MWRRYRVGCCRVCPSEHAGARLTPTRLPPSARQDSRLGSCNVCSMSFCVWCGQTWHGQRPCRLNALADVLREYKSVGGGRLPAARPLLFPPHYCLAMTVVSCAPVPFICICGHRRRERRRVSWRKSTARTGMFCGCCPFSQAFCDVLGARFAHSPMHRQSTAARSGASLGRHDCQLDQGLPRMRRENHEGMPMVQT